MQINISSQFMKNYESGSPVSDDRELATAIDENGEVLFFSIGSDEHLYCFKKDPGTDCLPSITITNCIIFGKI